MSNTDMSGLSGRVELYNDYCSSVSFPLSDASRQTRVVMELLLDRGHFEDICNLAFGPMFNPDQTSSSMDPTSYSWVDVANNCPQEGSKFRVHLHHLLKPEGGLHRIMTAVSAPSSDFHSGITSGWKGTGGEGSSPTTRAAAKSSAFLQRDPTASSLDRDIAQSTQRMYRRTFPVPLRAMTPHVQDILRSVDTDMTDFSADRMPAALYAPFWDPPMKAGMVAVHGESLHHNQVTTNVHCTMLGYFLIRLSMYGAYRSQVHGAQIMNGSLRNGRISRYFNWMNAPRVKPVVEHVRKIMGESYCQFPSTDAWTFFEDTLVSYMQYYTKVEMVKTVSGQRYSAYIQWNIDSYCAALLAHYPSQQQTRFYNGVSKEERRVATMSDTVCEGDRKALHNPSHCAMVAKSLFYITETFSAHFDILKDLPGSCQNHLVSPDFDARAYSEVTLPFRAVYRTCLIAFRQLAVSVPHFPNTPNQIHFDFIRMFRVLCTTPLDFSEVDKKYYFMSHYEVYSYLMRDVLRYVFTTNFCAIGERTTLRNLRRCLEELSDESLLLPLLMEADGVVERQSPMELSRIQNLFVLDWGSSKGGNLNQTPALISPFGAEVISAAARARLAVHSERMQLLTDHFGPDADEISVPESDEVPPVKTFMQKLKGGEPVIYRIHELSRLETLLTRLFPASTEEIINIQEGRGGSMSASPSPRSGNAHGAMPFSPRSRSITELPPGLQQQQGRSSISPQPFMASSAYAGNGNVVADRAVDDLGPEREFSLSSQGWRGDLSSRMKGAPRVMTTRERLILLKGQGESLHPSLCRGLRFAEGTIDSKSYQVGRLDEIAFLVPFTALLDSIIQGLQRLVMGWSLPTCPRGHKLVLVSDVRKACTHHQANRAIWECPSCYSAACDTCVSAPIINVTGVTYRRVLPYSKKAIRQDENPEEDIPVNEMCSKCFLVIRGEFAVGYQSNPSLQNSLVCPTCALQPWKLLSVRFLASSTFYLWVMVVLVIYYLFIRGIFSGVLGPNTYGFEESAPLYYAM